MYLPAFPGRLLYQDVPDLLSLPIKQVNGNHFQPFLLQNARSKTMVYGIGLESLQNFKLKCVNFCYIILSTMLIEENFRLFATMPEIAFLISSIILELQHF